MRQHRPIRENPAGNIRNLATSEEVEGLSDDLTERTAPEPGPEPVGEQAATLTLPPPLLKPEPAAPLPVTGCAQCTGGPPSAAPTPLPEGTEERDDGPADGPVWIGGVCRRCGGLAPEPGPVDEHARMPPPLLEPEPAAPLPVVECAQCVGEWTSLAPLPPSDVAQLAGEAQDMDEETVEITGAPVWIGGVCGQCGGQVPEPEPVDEQDGVLTLPLPRVASEPVPEVPVTECARCTGELPPPAPTPLPLTRATSCSQCGGPAGTGSRLVPVTDRYGREVPWAVCGACDRIGRGPEPDATALADLLECRGGDAVAQLALCLAREPAPHPAARVEVGWAAFSRRLDGLGPYHRVHPNAAPGDEPGERWGFLPGPLVARIAADVQGALYLRTPRASPSGRVCARCGKGKELPVRWALEAGRVVCGDCHEQAQAARPVPEHLDPGRMGAY
jgi:hypothetical protein